MNRKSKKSGTINMEKLRATMPVGGRDNGSGNLLTKGKRGGCLQNVTENELGRASRRGGKVRNTGMRAA